MKRLNLSKNDVNSEDGHEYAIVSLTDGKYNGARATINLWNPTVVDPDASFSQIWLAAGPDEDANTVEAGWMVNKGGSFTGQAEIFTYWTSDGYNKRGCYNVKCIGFVQTDKIFLLGSAIQPVSTYDGQQHDIKVEIKKDMYTGSWVLCISDMEVGFWPQDLFTHLRGPADAIDWGGETGKKVPDGRPTSTQMGSGHFPSEGYGKASYFRNLKFLDDEFNERDPENLNTHVTRPECYDLVLNEDPLTTYGVNFFYGGPGISAQCAN
ncbi:hypothetical protein NL676_035421 [Syzygium grande]|nr:hypothetical protein NL676_035421 [Syzygium grande]